jgi:hypothetical protein
MENMGWAGHAELMGEMMKAYNVLVETLKERGRLGRPRHRWDDNSSG